MNRFHVHPQHDSRLGPAIHGACRRAEEQQRERRASVSVPRVGLTAPTPCADDIPRRRSAAAIMLAGRQSARQPAPPPQCSRPLLGEAEKYRLSLLMQFSGSLPGGAEDNAASLALIARTAQQERH